MTFPARTLLACWMAVVATGTDVAHCHAAGEGHAHGLGLISVGGPAAEGFPFAHHHFVLCGIEFEAGASDPAAPPDGARPALTDVARPAHDVSAAADLPTAHLDYAAIPFGSGSVAAVSCDLADTPPVLPPATPVRSSVLRL
jgi:hypothetical protein